MRKFVLSAIVFSVVATAGVGAASENFSGIAFGDAYAFLGHHDDAVADANGVWTRRVYFTYDNEPNDKLKFRFRLEAGSPGVAKDKGKIEPFAKDAYLQWTPGGDGVSVLLGLSGTPSFMGVESAWGYRHVEKTPADLYKLAGTRESGIGIKGELNSRLKYHVMVGNGNGTSSEDNKGKKYMGALGLSLTDDISLSGHFDFDDQKGPATFMTAQAVLSQKTSSYRWGLHYALNNQDDGNADASLNLISAYGVYNLNETSALLARIDMVMDENPTHGPGHLPLATGSKLNFFLLGYDMRCSSGLHLIPNVEMVMYDGKDDEGKDLDSDIVARLTFSYKWK